MRLEDEAKDEYQVISKAITSTGIQNLHITLEILLTVGEMRKCNERMED